MKEEMTVESESLHWNVDMEVNLFHAMRGHKPVGMHVLIVNNGRIDINI